MDEEISKLFKILRETGDVANYKANLQNALLEASKKAGALGKVEVFEKMDGDPPQKATFFRVYAHENLAPVAIVRQKEITTCIELYIMKLYKEKNLTRDV